MHLVTLPAATQQASMLAPAACADCAPRADLLHACAAKATDARSHWGKAQHPAPRTHAQPAASTGRPHLLSSHQPEPAASAALPTAPPAPPVRRGALPGRPARPQPGPALQRGPAGSQAAAAPSSQRCSCCLYQCMCAARQCQQVEGPCAHAAQHNAPNRMHHA